MLSTLPKLPTPAAHVQATALLMPHFRMSLAAPLYLQHKAQQHSPLLCANIHSNSSMQDSTTSHPLSCGHVVTRELLSHRECTAMHSTHHATTVCAMHSCALLMAQQLPSSPGRQVGHPANFAVRQVMSSPARYNYTHSNTTTPLLHTVLTHVLMMCCSFAKDLTVRMPASVSCAVAEAAAAAVSWLVTYFLFKPGGQQQQHAAPVGCFWNP